MALKNGDKLVTVAGLRGVYDQLNSKLSSVYKPCGSIVFADLPEPSANTLGNIYNITDDFTTTSKFVEGKGTSCSAGTNVGIILVQVTDEETGEVTDKYKYDLFSKGAEGNFVTQKQFTAAMSEMSNYVRDVEFQPDDTNTVTVTKGNGSSSTYTLNIGKNTDIITDITIDTSLSTDLGRTTGRRIAKDVENGQVSLWWSDPEDDDTSDTWGETIIIKKKGGFPTSIEDGTFVVICAVRDRFKNKPYIDTQEAPDNWYYCAFPVATTGAIPATAPANKFEYWHYAICIDETDAIPTTCVSYVDGFDNEGYKPLSVDFSVSNIEENKCNWGSWEDAPFMPRPCMLKSDGTVDYYLDPNDYTKKENGEDSDVADTSYDGNAMMEFNKVFIKANRVDDKLYIYFCSDKNDDDYECWPCKKEDGTYAEHYYMSIYQASLIDSKLRSMSTNTGPKIDVGNPQEIVAYAAANGNGWNTILWSDWETFTLLCILVTKRLDVVNATTRNSKSAKIGSSNKKGMFWGSYSNQSTYNGKAFGIEMPWGASYRYFAGMTIGSNNVVYLKRTYSKVDGSSVLGYDTNGTGYINTGMIVSNGYIKKIQGNNVSVILPLEYNASSSTYYCTYTSMETSVNYNSYSCMSTDGPFGLSKVVNSWDRYSFSSAALSYKGF